ncbi:DUF998 domain-containing protein [Plantactinospora siamensis]|uniref:DUF998 domain-containing protein n=1 Tax=Plantactinospora siamensis TaxID=555372 RepID=A0ABV6P0V8_9ACTN
MPSSRRRAAAPILSIRPEHLEGAELAELAAPGVCTVREREQSPLAELEGEMADLGGTTARPHRPGEPRPARPGRCRAVLRAWPTLVRALGLAAAGVTLLLFALLHVLVARLSPVSDTISDYALSSARWIFDAGVLALAAASIALLGPLLRSGAGTAYRWIGDPAGAYRWIAGTAAAGACFGCWCLGLVVLTAFPRDPIGMPDTVTGQIHQWASVVALLGLPLGALSTALRHRGTGAARVVAATAAGCLVALVPFVIAYLAGSPLRPYVGLLERLVAVTEIVLLVLLGTVLPRPAVADSALRPGSPGRPWPGEAPLRAARRAGRRPAPRRRSRPVGTRGPDRSPPGSPRRARRG